MTGIQNNVGATIKEAVIYAERYYETTNNILGVLAVTAGLSCFSTDNVQFYAWFAHAFLLLAWGASFEGYRRRLIMLRIIKHINMTPWYIIKRCYVAIIGWLFLLVIALGIVDKSGWVGL